MNQIIEKLMVDASAGDLEAQFDADILERQTKGELNYVMQKLRELRS